ncbi:MAG TPA: isocitrate/isopropylmalate dehydrogenase family protein [Acetobacteraceae bacterium]|jgi:3-isopropylmalate dehydrogenase
MTTNFLILPGDGIGPEIVAATLTVLRRADARFNLGLSYETRDIGLVTLRREGTTLPASVLDAVQRSDGVILGPVSHLDYPPAEQGGVNPSGILRTHFNLYANIRPARSREGMTVLRHPMDLVIVRENTEGFYADRNMAVGIGEFMPTPDMALAIRKVTAEASRRIARTAFELARTRRRHVTAVHKQNVLRISDALFLREVRAIAADYPDVTLDDALVDAMAAHLVRDPSRYDVIVTTNMFGDILSDEASELAGSLGLGASLNAGDDRAVAQAQHGSAPDIAGQDRANPTALLLSTAMLLRWLGGRRGGAFVAAADAMEVAVEAAVATPAERTADLGGTLGTQAFAAVVAGRLAA